MSSVRAIRTKRHSKKWTLEEWSFAYEGLSPLSRQQVLNKHTMKMHSDLRNTSVSKEMPRDDLSDRNTQLSSYTDSPAPK